MRRGIRLDSFVRGTGFSSRNKALLGWHLGSLCWFFAGSLAVVADYLLNRASQYDDRNLSSASTGTAGFGRGLSQSDFTRVVETLWITKNLCSLTPRKFVLETLAGWTTRRSILNLKILSSRNVV